MLKFTKDHEWLMIEGDIATIGITALRAGAARRSRFRRVAQARQHVANAGAAAAVVESVKAASDVYAPIDGEVIEINAARGRGAGFGQFRSDGRRLAVQDQNRQIASEIEKLMDEPAYRVADRGRRWPGR